MSQLSPRPLKRLNLLGEIRELLKAGRYVETTHVQDRKRQRGILLQDIKYVLIHGKHEKIKDKFDEEFQAWNYAIRGFTIENEELRVIISFDQEEDLLIITAFFL